LQICKNTINFAPNSLMQIHLELLGWSSKIMEAFTNALS
jgi:hypothetical protein